MTPISLSPAAIPSSPQVQPDPSITNPGPNVLANVSDMAVREIPPFFVTKADSPVAEAGGDQLARAISTLVPGPEASSSPTQVLAAQMALMEAMMSWEFTSQVAAKVDSGIQSLFNSQV